jgi:hypothetical protein
MTETMPTSRENKKTPRRSHKSGTSNMLTSLKAKEEAKVVKEVKMTKLSRKNSTSNQVKNSISLPSKPVEDTLMSSITEL